VWQRRGLVLFALAVVVLLAMHSQNDAQRGTEAVPVQRTAQTQPDAFQAALESMRDRYGFPGATAAYAWTDGTSGVAATGLADIEAGTPMTTESRMLAASIGKTFVGATAAALAQEGTLDLDVPIAQWLGDRPWFGRLPHHDRITLRHLLTHRSGLPDHVHTDAFAAEVSRRWRKPGPPFTSDSLVQFVLDQPPLFDAGEAWSYTDTGFILVGLVIEEATGRDYYDIIQERFLTPLNLRLTSPSNSRDVPGLAAGYAAENAFGFPKKTTSPDGTMAWHPGIEWTGGGLASTSADLARWGAALFGGAALPEAVLDLLMTSFPIDPEMPGVHYGMGVAIYQATPSGPVFGHGGWIPGYTSSLRYYAEYGVAIAFQINTDIGLVNDTSAVVPAVEAKLAEVVLSTGRRMGKLP
jgi:D-alanyl-D-alanine carboxypeptidase